VDDQGNVIQAPARAPITTSLVRPGLLAADC
jgi:hypothetical protein